MRGEVLEFMGRNEEDGKAGADAGGEKFNQDSE
jgi:hypothetical protein